MIIDQSEEIFTRDCISMHKTAQRVWSTSFPTCGDSVDTMFQPKENWYAHLNDLKSKNVFDESE